jgi:hypothetical protein
MLRRLSLLAPLIVLLAGCDQLGIESASVVAARQEAEGKAVGAACRHAGRAIEDCFALNHRTDKASIYAGWREMDDYMRENKIEPVAPVMQPGPVRRADADAPADAGSAVHADAQDPKADHAAKPDKPVRTDKTLGKPDEAKADKVASGDIAGKAAAGEAAGKAAAGDIAGKASAQR